MVLNDWSMHAVKQILFHIDMVSSALNFLLARMAFLLGRYGFFIQLQWICPFSKRHTDRFFL